MFITPPIRKVFQMHFQQNKFALIDGEPSSVLLVTRIGPFIMFFVMSSQFTIKHCGKLLLEYYYCFRSFERIFHFSFNRNTMIFLCISGFRSWFPIQKLFVLICKIIKKMFLNNLWKLCVRLSSVKIFN